MTTKQIDACGFHFGLAAFSERLLSLVSGQSKRWNRSRLDRPSLTQLFRDPEMDETDQSYHPQIVRTIIAMALFEARKA